MDRAAGLCLPATAGRHFEFHARNDADDVRASTAGFKRIRPDFVLLFHTRFTATKFNAPYSDWYPSPLSLAEHTHRTSEKEKISNLSAYIYPALAPRRLLADPAPLPLELPVRLKSLQSACGSR